MVIAEAELARAQSVNFAFLVVIVIIMPYLNLITNVKVGWTAVESSALYISNPGC